MKKVVEFCAAFGASAAKVVREILLKFRNFSYSGLGTFSIFLTLIFLLFTTNLAVTQSIFNPFSGLNLQYSLIISIIATFLGHYYGIRLTQDGRLKIAVFYAPIGFGVFLGFFSLGVISVDPSNPFIDFLGYFVVLQIALLAGILSGEMKDANWLGHALFMRHINDSLPGMGIKYLYWDSEGKRSLVEPGTLDPRWSGTAGAIACRINQKEIPFSHFTPVLLHNKKISSAHTEVKQLFDTLTVTWKEAMSKHRQALDDGKARTSWLNLAQLTIPNNPDSMTVRSSKMPAKNQRIEIGDEKLILSWSLPNEDWFESCLTLFKTDLDTPIFHSILMNQSPPEDILDLEGVLTRATNIPQADKHVRVNLLRSYLNLMVLLFGNISNNTGTQSELSKYCIRSTSKWYKNLTSGAILSEISKLSHFEEPKSVLNSIPIHEWGQKFNNGLNDPTSLFLSLHDNLLNLINENKYPKEITACVQSILNSSTSDVIKSNSRKPIVRSNHTLSYGSKRELGINRKGAVLAGICKMNFMYSLIHNTSGEGI